MRYEDWDILIFPRDIAIPMKEFKVACHVVHDVEFAHSHGSFGLPTMTCFIPSLAASTPFNISIHSWRFPEISQFTRSYSKHPELVKFEARVLIDGKFVASTSFDRKGTWPHLLSHSFEFTKNGDLEPLKFPIFRKELLHESLWSPADEVGRIKLIISEGFPRDSLSMPIERVKNVVAFSFQHAPLQILESSAIAWPNPVMWRRAPLTNAMQVPSYPSDDGPETHAHSPRRRHQAHNLTSSSSTRANPATSSHQAPLTSFMPGLMPTASSSSGLRQSRPSMGVAANNSSGSTAPPDPFSEPEAYYDWMANVGLQDMSRNGGYFGFGTGAIGAGSTGGTNGIVGAGAAVGSGGGTGASRNASKISSTDSSMPDYISSHHSGRMSLSFPDHGISSLAGRQMNLMDGGGLKVPTNTPTAIVPNSPELGGSCFASTLRPDLSLANSLLCQPVPLPIHPHNISLPASEVKSRKENLPVAGMPQHLGDESSMAVIAANSQMLGEHPHTASSVGPICGPEHRDIRKVSQPLFGIGSGISMGTVPADPPGQQLQPIAPPSTSNSIHESMSRSGSLSLEQVSVKRLRNFTPASARVIDEEDEPRRISPHTMRRGHDGADDELESQVGT